MGSKLERDVTICSLQVGCPRVVATTYSSGSTNKIWTTAIFKSPVSEPIWLGTLNLDGDRQADLIHHGGSDKAICAYPANHYPYWQERLVQPEMKFGGFGENLTLANVAEDTVCIGDVWSIGEAIIQVSQPRQPCWKLAKRWNIKDLAYQAQQTGRTGWYFRVLNEGFIAQGMPLKLMDRSHAEWSVARANQIMHFDKTNFDLAAQLAAIPLLSASWRTTLTKRIRDRVEPNVRSRLEGPL